MINRFITIFFALTMGACLGSCDDGDISEEMNFSIDEGYTVKLNGSLNKLDQWNSSQYQVVVAAFAAQDSYPLLAKAIPSHSDSLNFLFDGINPTCETIELCVLNLINKRVATLSSIYVRSEDPDRKLNDTIICNFKGMDVGMYSTIQSNIFTKRCAYCHGMGETPAAGLYLTEGDSYASLVNVISKKIDSLKRVSPGDAENSMLYKVLTEYGEECGWHYDHTKFFYGNSMSNLVKEWINSGAPQ